jgi:alpha-mannosidase
MKNETPKKIHMVCNAHLDPVWLWHWEDGVTEALSTYHIAADFCDEYPDFVFNHNESLLYAFVQKYDVDLHKRIKALVKRGQWKIAGGAYLQPDVNGTSGESHIRQFLFGLKYFKGEFKQRPRTAYNFDPFGHGEGFQQVLEQCGFSAYIFCRPDYGTYELPVGSFVWKDRSGAEVVARRSDDGYNSRPDNLGEDLAKWTEQYKDEEETMLLWGIGNHGGGPSREMYRQIESFFKKNKHLELVHSSPDDPGCYTSMSRVKRAHRDCEGLMATAERLAALAWWFDGTPYPQKSLESAWKDILFCEFHDILPGSGVPAVETDSLSMMGRCTEILRRCRFDSIITVLQGEQAPKGKEVPVFIINPHGFRLKSIVEFELQLDQLLVWQENVSINLKKGNRNYLFQRISQENNLGTSWRVRLAVHVDLKPFEILRLDASYNTKKEDAHTLPSTNAKTLKIKGKNITWQISPKTGLIEQVLQKGSKESLVKKNSFRPVVFQDHDHSWTTADPQQMEGPYCWAQAPRWKKVTAAFKLATKKQMQELSPLACDKWSKKAQNSALPVRIIEDGEVCTIVEAAFMLEKSALIRHYVIDKKLDTLEIRDRVFYQHKDHMLKLEVPLNFKVNTTNSETIYSAQERTQTKDFTEQPNQRWVSVQGTNNSMSVANTGSFAHNLTKNTLYLNVMRSPAYASFGMKENNRFTDKRFRPRQDQGEHLMSYLIRFSEGQFNEMQASHDAALLNASPWYQVYYPRSKKKKQSQLMTEGAPIAVSAKNVEIVAVKKAEKSESLIIRVLEHAGKKTTFTLNIKGSSQSKSLMLMPYQLKTYAIQKKNNRITISEVNAVEGF